MSYEDAGTVQLVDHIEAISKAEQFLKSDRLLVGHNIAFDMAVLAAAEPDLLPLIFKAYEDERVADTMLRQILIDIAEGKHRRFYRVDGKNVKISYGLDDLCLRHLGCELPKTEIRLKYGELRGVPIEEWPELAVEYVMTDAAVTSAVYEAQEDKRWSLYLLDQYRQSAAAWWIHLMGVWGLRTDEKGVREFAAELQKDFDQKWAALKTAGIMREDGTRDTKAAQSYMMKVCNKKKRPLAMTKPSKKFPEGQISLSADHCNATGDKVLEAYAEISSLKKQLSTDIPLLKRGIRLPLHPRFISILETGRTASKPNVQNLPVYGKMRECFIPRPGCVYASADFDGFELRTMSQFCISKFGKSKLAEALNAGLDPHLVVAGQILKIPYEEVKRRFKSGDDEAYRARQTAKVFNFGAPGGSG